MAAEVPREFEAFLAEPRNAILCIARGPGAPPHATPVWFHYRDGRLLVSITRTSVKFRLLERAPEVTLVVDDASRYTTVIVYGRAELLDDDESLAGLSRSLREKYDPGAAAPSGPQLLRELRQEQRVVVSIVPSQVVSWAGE